MTDRNQLVDIRNVKVYAETDAAYLIDENGEKWLPVSQMGQSTIKEAPPEDNSYVKMIIHTHIPHWLAEKLDLL